MFQIMNRIQLMIWGLSLVSKVRKVEFFFFLVELFNLLFFFLDDYIKITGSGFNRVKFFFSSFDGVLELISKQLELLNLLLDFHNPFTILLIPTFIMQTSLLLIDIQLFIQSWYLFSWIFQLIRLIFNNLPQYICLPLNYLVIRIQQLVLWHFETGELNILFVLNSLLIRLKQVVYFSRCAVNYL